MYEGQNLLAMFSFRDRNGRVNGVVGGLEVDTGFLDQDEAVFLTFVFKCGHLFRVRLTWLASFSWLLVKLQLLKLPVGQKDVTAV